MWLDVEVKVLRLKQEQLAPPLLLANLFKNAEETPLHTGKRLKVDQTDKELQWQKHGRAGAGLNHSRRGPKKATTWKYIFSVCNGENWVLRV